MKVATRVTVNAEGPATTLTVRAHGVLAGGVGPVMRVLVNGVEVGSVEVRATEPADYNFAVPALQAGAKVDLVYTNDATVGGVDRNLFIAQLLAGTTVLMPNAADGVYDRGYGAAALDGIDTVRGQGAMVWAGALRLTWPEPNLTSQVTVRASATLAGGVGPQMDLRVDGVVVGSTEVRSAEPADHVFAVPPLAVGSRIDVAYTNDAIVNGQDRNLNVHYLMAGTAVLLPTAAGTTLDLGSGLAAFDGANVQPGQVALASNGALRGKWPAANMSDTLTLRVSGTPAGSVAPQVEVLVDGVVLGTADVRSTTPADLRFATLPMAPGAQVQVRNTNAGTLSLAYAMAGKTVLRPTDAGVQASAATPLQGVWPQSNLTDTLTVRAKGTLAGGIGPVMQVLVDGVLVGTTEVRSTDFADHSFPTFVMQPGSKVDVVFAAPEKTSDAADRDLMVAYATSGNTFLVPNAAGNTYDRGAEAAAFDGVDVIPAQGTLFWYGALRGAWPHPNVTSTVTIRASGILAGNVGPVMRLWVDGIAVSSVEVRSATPTDYAMPSPPVRSGSKVAVTFDNPETVTGTTRELRIGYLIAGATVLQASTAGATYEAGNLSGTWPAPTFTDTLTVRAHANLSGDVGAQMQVLVDGVLVGSAEVRAIEPQDYQFAVPPLKPGSRVDLAYVNNVAPGSADRNLHVIQLSSGGTYLMPHATGNTVDRGLGAAAFDGLDVLAGQGSLFWDSALRTVWPEPNLPDRLTVRASATLASGVGAIMVVRVDGVVVGSTEVRAANPTDHEFAVPLLKPGSRVDIAFANSDPVNAPGRSLIVANLKSGLMVLLPQARGVVVDLGSGLAAFDGANTQAGQSVLASPGALRGSWPVANMTDSITVRAAGRIAGNVGPIMQVLVDGVLIGTVEVRSATPTDYILPTLPLKPGALIETVYTNDAVIGSEDRDLTVAYAMAGSTVMLATGGALRGAWPELNLKDSLTVRAKGALAGGVGPVVQVLVDGILVGSAEVRSSEFSDYAFAVPTMQPGRQVDVVYANDAVVGGVDRNLFVAYVAAGSTYLLPTGTDIKYDRGAGAAALDGLDMLAASGNMFWGGALRATWPQPNITSAITVRASGVLANNVGPIMRLWVDGVAVSTAEVRSTMPTDYTMPCTPLKPGSKVAVTFTNPETVSGVTRQLNIAYLLAGATVLQTGASGSSYAAGNLTGTWPVPNINNTITVRASATLANNIGALMQLRVNGVIVGAQEVRASTPTDYVFASPSVGAGSKIDVVFTNDQTVNGQDRNLYVQYVKAQGTSILPTGVGARLDSGSAEYAFDGLNLSGGNGAILSNGALRLVVPEPAATDASLAAQFAASRFLQQASFGPTHSEIQRVASATPAAWINEQAALPFTADMLSAVQSKYDLGDAYRPRGSQYTPNWIGQRFWASAANSPDQLRRRVGFALHQIFMVSLTDSNLYFQARAYASYLDTLNRHALGNFRHLLEDVALSPAMGIYLSHMRNRPESLGTGRMPDENFAREVMQLFTIGLHELNTDGSAKLDAGGRPIETYTNDDVMALAKVFTGWSWAFPDSQLTEQVFRWGNPDTNAANDQRIDTMKLKAYPGQHSVAEKRLFRGKPNALVIPANTSASESLRLALDTLFNHPNVGPFIGRQLIQRLVTSHPSPAYVARVAATFNSNGRGVRGDMAAVTRAVLLDPEAIAAPAGSIGKLREPVIRVAHWLRSFDARSTSGQYMLATELEQVSQRALHAPSVFGYFRPGFVPPNTTFSASGTTVPELQIVNESTTAQWVNTAQRMAGSGLGWAGTANDVIANLQPLADLVATGNADSLIQRLNLLLFAGRMSPALKQELLESMASVPGSQADSQLNRARVALFLALASPDYLVQR